MNQELIMQHLCVARVLNRFCKLSLNDLFLFRFQKRLFRFLKKTIVFKNNRFELLENEQQSFLKTIVFITTICERFLYDCFFKKRSTKRNDKLYQNGHFWNKITCNFIECRLTLSLTVVGELKLHDIFLKTTQ